MTPSDLKRLKEMAEKATPGPYKVWDGSPWHAMSVHYEQGGRGVFKCDWMNDVGMKQAERNAAYFAALDPATVLALIEMAERKA